MGRDLYNVNSTLGTVLLDMRVERRLQNFAANRELILDQRARNRARRVRILEKGIRKVLSRGDTDPFWLRRYADNYERFPEIRHFASDVLYVAHVNGRLSSERSRAIAHLNKVIRKFNEHS